MAAEKVSPAGSGSSNPATANGEPRKLINPANVSSALLSQFGRLGGGKNGGTAAGGKRPSGLFQQLLGGLNGTNASSAVVRGGLSSLVNGASAGLKLATDATKQVVNLLDGFTSDVAKTLASNSGSISNVLGTAANAATQVGLAALAGLAASQGIKNSALTGQTSSTISSVVGSGVQAVAGVALSLAPAVQSTAFGLVNGAINFATSASNSVLELLRGLGDMPTQ